MKGGKDASRRLRVDLHAHSRRSPDAVTAPAELVERAREVGLDRVAVTDHGTLEGALEAREIAPDLVIVGEEIRCRCRTELIGLFLSERVPDALALEEVVERIRDQGGVIYAPHPYAYPLRARWRARRALEVADVAEVYNARAFLPAWNRSARRAAEGGGIPAGAGSDAHFPVELGRAYTEMPSFRDAREFRAALPAARAVGVAITHPAYLVASSGLKAWRTLTRFGERIGETWAPARTPRTASLEP